MKENTGDFEEIARLRWNELQSSPETIIERFKDRNTQTSEIVLDLGCGRELNILVAKYIMGHEVVSDQIMGEVEGIKDADDGTIWSSVRQYSEDMADANAIVDRMVEEGYLDALTWHTYGSGKYTPAEAICKRAFLRKMLGK